MFSIAENIALLAETALRFLELVQLKNLNMENEPNGEEMDEASHPSDNYDTGNVTFCLLIIANHGPKLPASTDLSHLSNLSLPIKWEECFALTSIEVCMLQLHAETDTSALNVVRDKKVYK